MKRCFLFKPDGIGDFFLSSGTVRLLAREFGEENLVISVLPVLEPVVRAQFPKATPVILPIRKKRILLNVFVANCIRCFPAWRMMLGTRVDVAISLRHMRDYLMNVLFYSVPAARRVAVENMLLGNGRPVRRWTEKVFLWLFSPRIISYPPPIEGIPREIEANRRLLCEALGRQVRIEEVWPELRRVGDPGVQGTYWICAPFANGGGKDFPVARWVELFVSLRNQGRMPVLLLTGSKDQSSRLESFREALVAAGPEFADSVQVVLPTDLQDFINLLAAAELVLTVDTAAAHAATALDRPTVVLFSGQHHGTFGPWRRSPQQIWIYPGMPPEGKSWHDLISSRDIETAVTLLLQGER